MKLNESLKFHGNINRIVELHKAGFGVYTIAGIFQDNQIDINSENVINILKTTKVLTKKALPKKVVKKIIDKKTEVQNINSQIPKDLSEGWA
ncbi:hypothetical protein GMMP15_1340012 [Candidatus Magnetomoraceae bacterium gMMP-15]